MTSLVCFRLRVLRHQHFIHRLFPECRTRSSSHSHHPAAWFYPHPVQFQADAHPVGSTGYLAGCPRFRTADLSFCHYHLLSQKTKLKIYYLCACITQKGMKAFIEILREKYGLAQPEAEKLLEQMELLTYRKGEHSGRAGERNSSF